ncbi:MAG TPA: hypothetical protein PLH85_04540, partial [Rhodocyclaceae bacterium]|nr:hypothetical protein [Rhodocyclaceae bacterium]
MPLEQKDMCEIARRALRLPVFSWLVPVGFMLLFLAIALGSISGLIAPLGPWLNDEFRPHAYPAVGILVLTVYAFSGPSWRELGLLVFSG